LISATKHKGQVQWDPSYKNRHWRGRKKPNAKKGQTGKPEDPKNARGYTTRDLGKREGKREWVASTGERGKNRLIPRGTGNGEWNNAGTARIGQRQKT